MQNQTNEAAAFIEPRQVRISGATGITAYLELETMAANGEDCCRVELRDVKGQRILNVPGRLVMVDPQKSGQSTLYIDLDVVLMVNEKVRQQATLGEVVELKKRERRPKLSRTELDNRNTVIRCRHYDGESQKALAVSYGLSPQQVSRIVKGGA